MRESGGQRAQAAASHTVVRVGFLRKRQAQKAEEGEGGSQGDAWGEDSAGGGGSQHKAQSTSAPDGSEKLRKVVGLEQREHGKEEAAESGKAEGLDSYSGEQEPLQGFEQKKTGSDLIF